LTDPQRHHGGVRKALRNLAYGEDARHVEAEVAAAARTVFRSRVAIGIVLLSIFSAVAAWRASVFDEKAVNAGARFHQELIVQQQRSRTHATAVSRDLTHFLDYERAWFMANALDRAARKPGADPSLAREAQRERTAAEELLEGFEVRRPTAFPDGTSSYDPAAAYKRDVTGDIELQGLRPAEALRTSEDRRHRAVDMTFVAALFVAALVLLTLAQVMVGREVEMTEGWRLSHMLVIGGTLVTLAGVVLFVLVMVA
jgi:hypothetical protein